MFDAFGGDVGGYDAYEPSAEELRRQALLTTMGPGAPAEPTGAQPVSPLPPAIPGGGGGGYWPGPTGGLQPSPGSTKSPDPNVQLDPRRGAPPGAPPPPSPYGNWSWEPWANNGQGGWIDRGGVAGPFDPTKMPRGPGTDFGGPGIPAANPNDPRAALSAIYQQYGLDPNNPTGLKNPLANVDYFLRRMNETGGWQGGNIDYWKNRLAQEIGLAQQGLGNRQEGGGGGVPQGGQIPHGLEGQAGMNPLFAQYLQQVGQPGQAPQTQTPGPNPQQDALQAAMRAQLLQWMGQPGENETVDENTAQVRQPYQAALLAAQRAQETERNAIAERLYGEGQGTRGNELTQAVQQSAERNAQSLGGLRAGLIQQELAQKRSQIQSALQMAIALGARQEALQLQRELANLENQYKYAALGQQGRQFAAGLAQQGNQFGQDLAFRYANLAQQGGQFGQELGFRQGQWNDQYGLARQAMINLMNRNAMDYGA